MAERRFWAADRLRILVEGPDARRFLSDAAAAGVRLRRVRCVGQSGYSAAAAGRDLARLRQLAERSGLQLRVLRRAGPGRLAERLWQRPGIWVGALLFVVLVRFLSGFVWTIDFGALDAVRAGPVRQILDGAGIREGTRVSEELLQTARQQLAAQPELFGWVGLNFAGGCLFVETTAMERQSIRTATPETALYASDNAQVLAVRVESGFAQAAPGQYVAKGQLLANAQRADRDGDPVYQSASGSVTGRVQRTFTALQPLRQTVSILTGRSAMQQTLYLPGAALPLEESQAAFAEADRSESWQPLALGQLALPGCLYIRWEMERADRELTYTPAAAEALAKRSCVQQLLAEYPDAEIEQQSFACVQRDGGVYCTAEFVFRADIARPGAMQPLAETPSPQA